MAAGLHALHAHGVGARPLGGLRLVGGGDGDDGERADLGEGVEDGAGGAAEGERDHRHRVVQQDRELGLVAVVAAAVGVAELGLVPGGLARELLGVDLDGGGVGVRGLRHEEIDAEGPAGQRRAAA